MTDQEKAPFNMAISTLERIGDILRDIHKTASNNEMSPAEKQFTRVSQIQDLLSNASPLLGEVLVNKFLPDIMNLKPVEKVIMKKKGDLIVGEVKQLGYSEELQKKLIKLEIDIQLELQKLKFFMPPRKDLGRAVADFN